MIFVSNVQGKQSVSMYHCPLSYPSKDYKHVTIIIRKIHTKAVRTIIAYTFSPLTFVLQTAQMDSDIIAR